MDLTNKLLQNVLPLSVIEKLKENPTHRIAGTTLCYYFFFFLSHLSSLTVACHIVLTEKYQNVSVLFADIVNFTSYCAANDPRTVVDDLNEIFTDFDRVIEDYGMYKVKTIGDGYMACAGKLLDGMCGMC
jgi:hypothetical protein